MKYKLSDLLELIMDFRGKTPKKLGLAWTENNNDILAISAKNIKDGALININKSHYAMVKQQNVKIAHRKYIG